MQDLKDRRGLPFMKSDLLTGGQEIKFAILAKFCFQMLFCCGGNFVLGANFIFLCFGDMVMYGNI